MILEETRRAKQKTTFPQSLVTQTSTSQTSTYSPTKNNTNGRNNLCTEYSGDHDTFCSSFRGKAYRGRGHGYLGKGRGRSNYT